MNTHVVKGIAIYPIIRDLCQGGLSGTLLIETITSTKKRVNLWKGRVISASSDLIDERLGEVMFRDGDLSLDDFVDAAGKVTKNSRFGDVLVRQKKLTPRQLWVALNKQVREILTSLCFYSELKVGFEPSEVLPKMEYTVQFNTDLVFREAIDLYYRMKAFAEAAHMHPKLIVEEDMVPWIPHDFAKDMLELVRTHGDYHAIVNSASRLSPEYTIKSLYSLYVTGFMVDSLGLPGFQISHNTLTALKQIVEDANFMFAEISQAAQKENVQDFEDIVDEASRLLVENIGKGALLTKQRGFLFDGILRAIVFQPHSRQGTVSYSENHWPGGLEKFLQDTMYSCVMYIVFELFNRNFQSQEFSRVRAQIDGMR